MVTVNMTAAQKFKELVAQHENPDRLMLRIYFGGYG
jgi:hypothetical protein